MLKLTNECEKLTKIILFLLHVIILSICWQKRNPYVLNHFVLITFSPSLLSICYYNFHNLSLLVHLLIWEWDHNISLCAICMHNMNEFITQMGYGLTERYNTDQIVELAYHVHYAPYVSIHWSNTIWQIINISSIHTVGILGDDITYHILVYVPWILSMLFMLYIIPFDLKNLCSADQGLIYMFVEIRASLTYL